MAVHSHRFVEEYDGFVGFGLDRPTDENTVIHHLQKLSDDLLCRTLVERMTDQELEAVFNLMTHLLKQHLSEDEYHRLFLKDRK